MVVAWIKSKAFACPSVVVLVMSVMAFKVAQFAN